MRVTYSTSVLPMTSSRFAVSYTGMPSLSTSRRRPTAAPIRALAPLLSEAAPARLFEECLKLFLSGHGVASFEGLERHGLLPALLPEAAAAMKANRSGALRAVVLEGLRGTDARVAADEPVSPAFLFALLLWPAYCRTLMSLQAQDVPAADAQRRAADRVTVHELQAVALPRRFSVPMQEIWLLQSRFGLRQRKRVMRLLAHPRFREVYRVLWDRDVVPDFREPEGIRLGLSPLSTSYGEVAEALVMVDEVLRAG